MGVEWVWEWQGNRRPQDVECHASRPATLWSPPPWPSQVSQSHSQLRSWIDDPTASKPPCLPSAISTQGQIARSPRPWLLREKTTHPSPGSFSRVLKKERKKKPLPTAPQHSVSHGDLSSHHTHYRRPKNDGTRRRAHFAMHRPCSSGPVQWSMWTPASWSSGQKLAFVSKRPLGLPSTGHPEAAMKRPPPWSWSWP